MPIRTKATVIKVEKISPTVANIHLLPEQKIAFRAGQYVVVQVEINGKLVRRSYSIASDEGDEEIILCVKRVENGKVSGFMHEFDKDCEIVLFSAAGQFLLKEAEEYVFIASGTGIAPIRSMIHSIKNKKITLLFGFRSSEEELFNEEFKNMNINYIPIKSREHSERNGYVQDHLEELSLNKSAEYYVCGLKDMVLATVEKLQELGVERKHIHFERYS